MMRMQIFKDNETRMIKPRDLQRFLDRGWQTAQPIPERPSTPTLPKLVVEATADVVTEEDEDDDPDLEPPLFSMPTNNQGD